MSVEKITARILQEAKEESEALRRQSEAERDAALAQAQQEAEKLISETAVKADKEAVTLKERRQSVAELEVRKLQLAAKQELVDEAFAQALDELAGMDAKKYQRFLLDMLAPYSKQKAEVVLNKKDKERLGKSLAKELAGTQLTVASDTAQIRGGFILRQGNVSLNASLEKLLETERQQSTAQIADLLFS